MTCYSTKGLALRQRRQQRRGPCRRARRPAELRVVAAPPLMLTRTNYSDWALVMRVQLHGQWEVVERLPRQP
jgi:hypothetical protein